MVDTPNNARQSGMLLKSISHVSFKDRNKVDGDEQILHFDLCSKAKENWLLIVWLSHVLTLFSIVIIISLPAVG